MFAIIAPGAPPLTEFPQIGPSQWAIEISFPSATNLLTLVLMKPMPEQTTLGLYWSAPPYVERTFIGAVNNNWPSDTFHTPWCFDTSVSAGTTISILLSIEPGLPVATEYTEDPRFVYAKKAALNFFRCVESCNFSEESAWIYVTTDVFSKWLSRFDQKYHSNPLFLLNTQ